MVYACVPQSPLAPPGIDFCEIGDFDASTATYTLKALTLDKPLSGPYVIEI